jgi:hypothetical protein
MYIPRLVHRKHGSGQQCEVLERIFLGYYGGNHLVLRQKSRVDEADFKWDDLGFKYEITDLEASS